MTPLASIVAVARGGVIGANNGLPWRIKEDTRLFKQRTLGHAVIMGRATFDSIGKPLVERRNIVVSRTAKAIPGCEVAQSVELALALAYDTDAMPFVIGGAAIYAATIDLVTDLYITEIDRTVAGDTYFPAFDRDAFEVIESTKGEEPDVTFLHLRRLAR
jgi:dihydrofolate reductase